MTAAAIPRFFLYGEPPQQVGERFLHLEALDDRTRPANWNIRPHTHANLNHIFHLPEGEGRMQADGRTLAFEAPCLLLLPAGVVHGFAFGAQSRGSVLTVSDAYLQALTRREAAIASVFASPSVLSGADDAVFAYSFARLAQELSWTAPGHEVAVEALLLTLLVELLRLTHHAAQPQLRRAGPQAALVASFRELLERRYRSNTGVEGYAKALGVSAKRLRGACLAVCEVTPGRVIHERLMLEARRLMLYSNMTVAEAAYDLGFDDPAYFTRVFSKSCGAAPRAFRRNAAQG